MNKVEYSEIFEKSNQSNEGIFIPFIVAGDPDYDTSLEIAKLLVDNGADALEIGFPFSDPVADGASVQNADIRAFNGGMTIKKCFKFLKELREYTDKPIGLLLYYNLVYKFGIDKFYEKLNNIGVNAVLIADLPPEEADDVMIAANNHDLEQIFIVSQATNNERLKEITKKVGGFIYIASVMGTTGARAEVEFNTTELITAGADGAIVGSALINIIADNLNNYEEMFSKIEEYVKIMKKSTRG